MNIHEHQAKEILNEFGAPVSQGIVIFNIENLKEKIKVFESNELVLKAQIHAGGRGKGGGVKLVSNLDDVKKTAKEMLGMTLITHQTGPEGKEVQRLLIEEALEISRELYAGIVLDRSKNKFVFMVSTEGGVEIEKVAEATPEKIIKEWISPNEDLRPFQARKLAFSLGLKGVQIKHAVKTFLSLWRVFKKLDCSLMEINPLVITESDDVIALDSKINFDDNALYRHKDLIELRDISEEEPSEVEADKFNLNYNYLPF